jgi:hypothetical protein
MLVEVTQCSTLLEGQQFDSGWSIATTGLNIISRGSINASWCSVIVKHLW